ncbi:RING-H2 finger protein ATL2-like [Impatiens glandulifera]|uniref:RING-H2 finger protein ATL2-like n=1 Tax=Impatiens glandulifera TaxID=253017 RepID=UPI001FB0F978|nr:RING-H2 finger protein ATL2-like [Impatiens glandulifera]
MEFDFDTPIHRDPQNYRIKQSSDDNLTVKLLFSAVVVLFAVIILILALYIYARCSILRSRRRHLRSRHRQIVIYMDSTPTTAVHGLDTAVLNSLPVFEYSPETHHQLPECAVCLSEFEENDKGRLLPKCNHSFHIDCIDMWFHSHSTCPLCRSLVEPVMDNEDVVVSVAEPPPEVTEPGPSERRKELAVEVPPRSWSGLNLTEMGQNSPATHGFKSPLSRFMSLTRNRRSTAGTTPSGGVGSPSSSCSHELDIEKGVNESTQYQSRSQTPR